jgi:hypothetical protein
MNDLNAAIPVPGPTMIIGVPSPVGNKKLPFFSHIGIGSQFSRF